MSDDIHSSNKKTPPGVIITNSVKDNGRKKLLVIGKTGTGKSSLCNVITGHPPDSEIFPISAKAISCTQSTQFADVFFRNNKGRPISLVDTIGFDDPQNDTDADIISELVHQLKHNCDYVNLFMIAVNGQNPRLDGALMGMIRIFEGMFGEDFWKQAMIVFTRVPMDQKMKNKREKNTKQSDATLAEEYLKVVEAVFPKGKGLQYLFMDACYDEDDPVENVAFNFAMEKLWKSLVQSPPLPTVKVQAVETESKQLKNAIMEKEKERQLILEKFEQKEKEWKEAHKRLEKQRKEDHKVVAAKEQARLLIDMEKGEFEQAMALGPLFSQLPLSQLYRNGLRPSAPFLKLPWRNPGFSEWNKEKRYELTDEISKFKLQTESIRSDHLNVLLVGGTSSGKSSFINNLDSAFHSYVINRAPTLGESFEQLNCTTKYQMYEITTGDHSDETIPLKFRFWDTMGIHNGAGRPGLQVEHVKMMLDGYVADGTELTRRVFCDSENVQALYNKIDCVIFLVDAKLANLMDSGLVKKWLEVREAAFQRGMDPIVVLTHVDSLCEHTKSNIQIIFKSIAVAKQVKEVSVLLGTQVNMVCPIVNYTNQTEKDVDIDILTLLALRRILRSCLSRL